jgi:hypothetical protein
MYTPTVFPSAAVRGVAGIGRDYLFAVVPHKGHSMRVSNFSMAAVGVVRELAVPARS